MTTIQDKAIKTCERLSCHEILDDDAACLQQEWDCDPRWHGIHRPYTPAEVLKLRGTLKPEYTFAEVGAQHLWHLLQTEDYIAALGAMTGNQAVQQEEFAHGKEDGYMAITHQTFVGTGYFDRVINSITEGESSVAALEGSTEKAQF